MKSCSTENSDLSEKGSDTRAYIIVPGQLPVQAAFLFVKKPSSATTVSKRQCITLIIVS